MIKAATLDFLKKLNKNNNKPWFDAHRDAYDAARMDFAAFVEELLKGLCELDGAFAGQQAKDCVYRIFRDVRFSNDKTPYKSHFGAFFARGGRKWDGAGFYFHLEPGKIFAGGGLWMPQAPLLKAVRQEIDYDFEAFKGIVENKGFKKYFPKVTGEALQKAPMGYLPDNPAIEFLKQKSFIVSRALGDDVIAGKKGVNEVLATFTVMKPFVDFLNRPQE